MGVFETIRENLTARQVAEYYGLRVNRNGMAVCPFHNDRNPSMKIDRRYYCFGCGEKGDAVDYVAKSLGLAPSDAALKIAEDFGLNYEKWKPPDRIKATSPAVKIKPLLIRFQETKMHFWRVITDYYHMLRDWKERYAPTDPEQEWDDRFVEALQNITQLEYIMDTFLGGDLETQVDIINDYGRKIPDYERRIKQFTARKAGSIGTDNAGNGTETGGDKAA